ncbi:MAG TPA: Pycsar system effector family protein [Usitatibacteraceae bacterium]
MSALEMVATVARERFTTAELALRLEQAWRIFNLNQDLIRAADQKIYVLFVMSTLLVTYVSTNLEKIMRQGALQRGILILFLMAVAAFFFFALSTVVSRSRKPPSAVSTLPRVVFFGDIAERESGPAYAEAFCSTDLQAIFDDICHQIYDVASIARAKYRLYRQAWMALLLEVALFLLLEFSIAL